MHDLPKSGYRRVLVLAAYILLGLGLGYLLLRYALKPLLPFLTAWVIAMAVRPAVRRICTHSKLPHKIVSFVAILFVFLLTFGLLTILCGRMIGELRELSDDLMADAAGAVGELFDSMQNLSEKFPFLDQVEDPAAAERREGIQHFSQSREIGNARGLQFRGDTVNVIALACELVGAGRTLTHSEHCDLGVTELCVSCDLPRGER